MSKDRTKRWESRRVTPWMGLTNQTPLQKFLDSRNTAEYQVRHGEIARMDEAEMLNSYDLTECKHCGSTDFISYGRNRYGVKRYRCKSCGKLFSIVTNTVFDNHKIPISEWMEFMLGVFRFQSFQSIGRSLRVTDTTVKYWISKLFLLLNDYQNDIVLHSDVQIDETTR